VKGWHEPAPGEHEAGERSWEVVRDAFAQRIPSPRRRDRRPLVIVALAAGVLAAAVTPPGQAVWSSIRDAVRTEDHLLSLPAEGRVLVNSPAGAWVVQRNGSKRLLSGYIDAAWSPHGLYLAAARGNDLVALEPTGRVHWKLPQTRPIGGPQWSYEGYRIAYLAGSALRIVNGDGTGDRLLRPNVIATFAWRPGTHELAFTAGANELVLMDVDSNRVHWRRRTSRIERLLWSDDGQRLLAAGDPPTILDAGGRTIAKLARQSVLPAAFAPKSRALALVTSAKGLSTVTIYSGRRYEQRRVVFSGGGVFAGIAWSPDRRWLLLDWRTADQWVFLRSTRVRRLAVRNIGNTFDSGPEHHATLAGWCCP
jgi:dipeptidyl aminopeptidase/acylaminoacyl peptidase